METTFFTHKYMQMQMSGLGPVYVLLCISVKMIFKYVNMLIY